MENRIKEIASNYIFGLMTSCLELDKNTLLYHDVKAALEDLDSLTYTVFNMLLSSGTSVSLREVAHYCTMYQQEALEQI